MNLLNPEPRRVSVQPSARPSGAPSRLDADGWFPYDRTTAKTSTRHLILQTQNHNLIPRKIGPTIGDHFMDLVSDLEWLYRQDLAKIYWGQLPF